MRGRVGWVGSLLVAAACAAAPLTSRVSAPSGPPPASRFEALPALADYALYFRARSAVVAARRDEALELASALPVRHPDSIWVGAAHLVRAQLLRTAGDVPAARAAFADARAALPEGSARWVRATLGVAEIEDGAGNAEAALDLARAVRRAAPRGLAGRRARRLVARIHRARPEIAVDHVEEAELRLREGDAAGSHEEAEAALASELAAPDRARAFWTRAQGERALGRPAVAETTCLALARELPAEPLAPRAIAAAAGWRWNADDDAGALRLYADLVRRFPDSTQAAEALYGSGRIAQEAGRYVEAGAAYTRLAERYPRASLAGEARWRAAWVRWLDGNIAAAEAAFARVAAHSGKAERASRIAAEYWRARALGRLGREEEARSQLEHVAEHHVTSFYAGLAEERLGRRPVAGEPPVTVVPPPFPADLSGNHAERARALDRLGLRRFARLELDAARADDVPRRLLVEAYQSIGAVGSALRLANARHAPSMPAPLRRDLYPLGFWDVVQPAARAHEVDPLLVLAVIRQESLFDPDAVSSAGARGLMQLLPSTAGRLRRSAGAPALAPEALHDVATNVDLGVTLLAQLLASYGGSTAKAVAAYNGGEDAVAKWQRRYAGREPDEFIELISFRETRDYVKAVLRNYRLYRLLWAAPSPATTSRGSPPKSPFDMITTTSPARALPTT